MAHKLDYRVKIYWMIPLYNQLNIRIIDSYTICITSNENNGLTVHFIRYLKDFYHKVFIKL